MGVYFGENGKAVLTWKETEDPVEPTAKASGFILYTRLDDGGFDTGRKIKAKKNPDGLYSASVTIEPGHIYSFRISAFNEGGESFPSETVGIGRPAKQKSSDKILIVNNFDRVSGPAFIDMPTYAGFDNRLDSGVPYVRDIAYIGDMYEFRRDSEYQSNYSPGFGASYDDYAGRTVAGNTFDYPYVHGKAIMKTGHAFCSCSNEAFCADTTFAASAWAADIICGKQVTTSVGSGTDRRYPVFPKEMQKMIRKFTSKGGNILISGANIGTDVWDSIYPVHIDSVSRTETAAFVKDVLGYKLTRNNGGKAGRADIVKSEMAGTPNGKGMDFHNEINPDCYCVESPDAIAPVSSKTGESFMRYSDTRLTAGTVFNGKGYRTVCLGFPIETLKDEKDIYSIISITLEFFRK